MISLVPILSGIFAAISILGALKSSSTFSPICQSKEIEDLERKISLIGGLWLRLLMGRQIFSDFCFYEGCRSNDSVELMDIIEADPAGQGINLLWFHYLITHRA